jgi:hypothetical protein
MICQEQVGFQEKVFPLSLGATTYLTAIVRHFEFHLGKNCSSVSERERVNDQRKIQARQGKASNRKCNTAIHFLGKFSSL